MFVELDMSLRAIEHKLTEDQILTPLHSKKFRDILEKEGDEEQKAEIRKKCSVWGFTAIREILQDPANIGVLVICKTKQTIGPDGRRRTEPHPNRKEVPGGIPAIISPLLYERAQEKGFLQRNTEEIVRKRIEITYSLQLASPLNARSDIPTGVRVSLHTRRYINVSACCTPCTL